MSLDHAIVLWEANSALVRGPALAHWLHPITWRGASPTPDLDLSAASMSHVHLPIHLTSTGTETEASFQGLIWRGVGAPLFCSVTQTSGLHNPGALCPES